MKKFSVLLIVVLVALVLSACGSKVPEVCETDPYGCAVIEEGDTIKIGMGAPMLGDYAMFGQDISQGVMVALSEHEFEGWEYELIAEDTGGSPEAGAAVANKFVTDNTMVAIAGHIFSGSTEAAMPIYEDAGFPMMSPSATLPELTQRGSTVFNRLAFTDATQAYFAAQALKEDMGFTQIAVMHDGSSYGQGLAEEVMKNFEEMGGTVVANEAITPGEADYSAALAAVAAASPEAVYYGGYAAEAIIMANQWKQSGLEGVQFFGCDGTYGVEFTQKTGDNGEGAVAVSLVPPDSAEKSAFDTKYKEMFGLEAGELSAFSWSAYDTGGVLVAAIEKVAFVEGKTVYVPRTALVEAVRTSDYTGLTGKVKCDETGECNASGPTFYVVENGVWVPFE
ncbi:MAG: branched-chain amino acid ABC transporter substrate-binding protein [Anaerolineaceae bacterium]|nr:branched-chain amino acid ABC transporter substrate-binding protein [Anaerolineaceae bacterium]